MVLLRTLVLLHLLATAYATQLRARNANLPRPPTVPPVPAPDIAVYHVATGAVLPPLNTTYYFDQLIDRANPQLGTFKQRYWHTWEWYEKGGPIILYTPGEENAEGMTGFLVNRTINGQIAQQEHGATIVIEHRYYGETNPFSDMSDKNLKYHTIQQAIDDLEYFAKTVKLAMPGGDSVGPAEAPWVLVGGSYSGALTSWTMVNKPGLFRAGYATSAVVEAIVGFWEYFEPVRQYMPKNCSADVEAVIAHVDTVLKTGSESQIAQLKDNFGVTELTHVDDVGGALRNNLWDWQSLEPSTGPNATFYQFCDALEVKNGVSAPSSGWGVDHALSAWGGFWQDGYLDNLCGGQSIADCLGTYDPTNPLFTDISVGNDYRSWNWIVCNEVGWFEDAAPVGMPTLVSRLAQPAYDARACSLFFPDTFPAGSSPVPRVAQTNAAYHGWDVHVDRLFFANGKRDPWRGATVSADAHFVPSTPEQPIAVSDGFHGSDLATSNALVDPTVLAVQQQALRAMHGWLQGFEPTKQGYAEEME
ncbi:serine carboxypeptidase S28 [Phanerochaete sordida]|uniref:Serine carboxypeptidase S28 n=1 Tax=Phanerochaete sordida TaxID=48140 RepID=A0A9P3L8T7_9APHY|nr:serine carboxypeptidase S28 [Phanerochaete sordida]